MSNAMIWGGVIIFGTIVVYSIYLIWVGMNIVEDYYENGGHR